MNNLTKSAQNLSVYENAKYWVAQYESVDDVKDYIDKAAALKEYARRSNDMQMEIMAARARVRAERKCGELLAETEKAKGTAGQGRPALGGQPNRPPKNIELNGDLGLNKPKTLKQLGLSKDQSSKYQKLAQLPEHEFEEAVTLPGTRPSTNHILQSKKPKEKPKQINLDALGVWGRFRDFDNKHFHQDLSWLVSQMTKPMQEDMQNFIPKFQQWLKDYYVATKSN